MALVVEFMWASMLAVVLVFELSPVDTEAVCDRWCALLWYLWFMRPEMTESTLIDGKSDGCTPITVRTALACAALARTDILVPFVSQQGHTKGGRYFCVAGIDTGDPSSSMPAAADDCSRSKGCTPIAVRTAPACAALPAHTFLKLASRA